MWRINRVGSTGARKSCRRCSRSIRTILHQRTVAAIGIGAGSPACRDAAVTLLFCDIRRFSSFSEVLGPQGTFELINDVMEVISECVIEHGGVLVDYIGDELMAMWGAPAACDDQAMLACRAGVDAVRRLPELNQRWRSRLGGDLDFGVGINSGTARVGNAASPRKFKYGPWAAP